MTIQIAFGIQFQHGRVKSAINDDEVIFTIARRFHAVQGRTARIDNQRNDRHFLTQALQSNYGIFAPTYRDKCLLFKRQAAHAISTQDVRRHEIYGQRLQFHQLPFRNRDAVQIKKLTQSIVIQLLPKLFLDLRQSKRLHHHPFRAGDFPIADQLRHADLESQGLQLLLGDAVPIEEWTSRYFQCRTKMVTVVKVEVKSQRQGPIFPLHRLLFKGKGGKRLAQGVKLGLIIGSFQNNIVLMPQNYEICPEYRPKILILQYGFRRKVHHKEQFVGAETR